MTMHSPEEREAFKTQQRLADAAERQAVALEKIAFALGADRDVGLGEKTPWLAQIADHLTGVINVIDMLDTNLGHHLADVAD